MAVVYKPKILVVDNDTATLRLLDTTLKAMGAAPRCLPSSKQAAEVVNKEKFDGAFLEWDTPELNGVELTKRIRASKSNPTIPIAMLTASKNAKIIAEAFKAGVTFFLSKPVGAKELQKLLNVSRGAMLAERRRYQRANAPIVVKCAWGDKSASGQGVNVSVAGLLVTLTPRPEVGTELKLEFTLPDGRTAFLLKGTVVRHGPGSHVGVKFHRLSAEEQEALKSYIERTLPGAASEG